MRALVATVLVIAMLQNGCTLAGHRKGHSLPPSKPILTYHQDALGYTFDLAMHSNQARGSFDIDIDITNRSDKPKEFPVPYDWGLFVHDASCRLTLSTKENKPLERLGWVGAKMFSVELAPGETLRVEGLTLGHYGYSDLMDKAYQDTKCREIEMDFFYAPSPMTLGDMGKVRFKKTFTIPIVESFVPPLFDPRKAAIKYVVLDKDGKIKDVKTLVPAGVVDESIREGIEIIARKGISQETLDECPLVVEGVIEKVEIDVSEDHPLMDNWKVTISDVKVLRGDYTGDKICCWIHSPSQTFFPHTVEDAAGLKGHFYLRPVEGAPDIYELILWG